MARYPVDPNDPYPDADPALCLVCAGTGRDCTEGADGRLYYVACEACDGVGELDGWVAHEK